MTEDNREVPEKQKTKAIYTSHMGKGDLHQNPKNPIIKRRSMVAHTCNLST